MVDVRARVEAGEDPEHTRSHVLRVPPHPAEEWEVERLATTLGEVGSHGEPVHDRAAYERALELPPWSG